MNSKPETSAPLELNAPSPDSKKRNRTRIVLLLVAIALPASYVLWAWSFRQVLPDGVTGEQFERATREWQRQFKTEPTDADVLMLLGEKAVLREQWDTAVACLRVIPSEHLRYGPSARLQEGQALLKLERAVDAERRFLDYLKIAGQTSEPAENQLVAKKWLVYLYAVELRFEDRQKVLKELCDDELADVFDAKQMFFPSLLVWHSNLGSSRLRAFLKVDPDNSVLQTAEARYLTHEGKPEVAEQLLQELQQAEPENLRITAAYLECLHEQNRQDDMHDVISRTVPHSDNEPWLLTQMRAEAVLADGKTEEAERYFQAVLKHDPANPTCHMGLARCLTNPQQAEARRRIQQRSLLLAKIRVDLSDVDTTSADAARLLASQADELEMAEAGRYFRHLADQMSSRNEPARP